MRHGRPKRPGTGTKSGDSAEGSPLVAELFEVHSAAVHAYLARRAGRQLADDLLADVWLRALRAEADPGSTLCSPLPWLYAVARNRLWEHWRAEARRRPPVPQLVVDPWEDCDNRLEASRLIPVLSEALAGLSDADREILLLVAWEELEPAEAAAVVGIPQGTARSRLHRARQSVQMHLNTHILPEAPATISEG